MIIDQLLCSRLLKDQYQYIIAIHNGHEHVHAHIIFNNVNMQTGRTFETEENQGKKPDRAWAKLRKIYDEICEKAGLSVIENPEYGKGISHYEWEQKNAKNSWKAVLRHDLDRIICDSTSFEDFLNRCAAVGIETVYTPENTVSLKFRGKGQERYTRAKTLGWSYLPENIKGQIELICKYRFMLEKAKESAVKNEPIPTVPEAIVQPVNKLETSSQWNNIQGMKNASQVISTLTEMGINSTEELKKAMYRQRIKMGAMIGPMDNISRQIEDITELAKQTKHLIELTPRYKEYKALSERKQAKYREKNRDFLEDYHYTLKYVQKHNGDDNRFLSLDALKAKRNRLLSEKSAKNMEYAAEKKKFDQMEKCRAQIENYQSRRHVAERNMGRKKGELE